MRMLKFNLYAKMYAHLTAAAVSPSMLFNLVTPGQVFGDSLRVSLCVSECSEGLASPFPSGGQDQAVT